MVFERIMSQRRITAQLPALRSIIHYGHQLSSNGRCFQSCNESGSRYLSSVAASLKNTPEIDHHHYKEDLRRERFVESSTEISNLEVDADRRMPRLAKLRTLLKTADPMNEPTLVPTKKDDNTSTPSTSWQDVLSSVKDAYGNSVLEKEGNKLHLLKDTYSRHHSYLRISLSERCNLRCQYCMPPEGVPLQPTENLLSADEIERLVRLFGAGGVDKVRLTGGEPLLRKDLSDIIASIRTQSNIHSVGITTNGITLSRHLPSLVEAGLTHVNISLDTLNADKFEDITRRKGLSKVMRAIEDACAMLPSGNVKVNSVVMKNFNDSELRDFIQMTKDLPLDVRFIEWMPFNDNGWNKDRFVSYDDMMSGITSDLAGIQSSMIGLPPIELLRAEDGPNDTTKWWRAPEHEGRVGFITSMTQHFCGTCNRLRLTADGKLKVCLFGSAEISLRDAMREGANDEDLGLIVWAGLQQKKFALGGHGSAEGIKKANNNRPMTLIGG